jgi:biopolymer transport protein ExbB
MKKKAIIMLGLFIAAPLALAAQNTVAATNAQVSSAVTNSEAGETPSSAMQPEKSSFNIKEFMDMGGIFMWPLLIFSVLGMAYLMERAFFYLRRKVSDDKLFAMCKNGGSIDDIRKYIEKNPSRLGDVLREVLRLSDTRKSITELDEVLEASLNIHILNLQKGFVIINTLINLAPLVGFLGTVSGMIFAFRTISFAEQVSVSLVAKGIYEALITTEVGLVIAIVLNFFYSMFVNKVENFTCKTIDAGENLIEKLVI